MRTITNYRELGEDGIDVVVIECEKDCKALGMKCVDFLKDADAVEYSCRHLNGREESAEGRNCEVAIPVVAIQY